MIRLVPFFSSRDEDGQLPETERHHRLPEQDQQYHQLRHAGRHSAITLPQYMTGGRPVL